MTSRRTRGAGGSLLLALSVAGLAGCFLADLVVSASSEPAFSHRIHVEDAGLDCTDCHLGVEDSDEPGMPVESQCLLCHEGLDADKPPERGIGPLFEDGKLAARHLSALPDEVRFSHLMHVSAALECSSCHGAVELSAAIGPEVRVVMESCQACHEALGTANECRTCHEELSLDHPPSSHAFLWTERHGELVRDEPRVLEQQRCSTCHGESSCQDCHLNERPRSHTSFWRRRGHAQEAAFDRNGCSTCHDADSCNRCHAEVVPTTHGATWGGSRNNHCVSCHFPLRFEGCFTCHRDTASHDLAPPAPADAPHMGATDDQCRACHAPNLRHADNGDRCRLCH
jgi:hypothetical protein